MISYEPPKQEAFGAGDYIEGLGTVLDPDNDEMVAFIEAWELRESRSNKATSQTEIRLVKQTGED